VVRRAAPSPGTPSAAASRTQERAMHTLRDESVLPYANAAAISSDAIVFDRAGLEHADDTRALARIQPMSESHLEAEWLAAELSAEPSGETLAAAFAAGCLSGMLAASLLVPALPALAFGGALGAYAGVLAASLWVSRPASLLR